MSKRVFETDRETTSRCLVIASDAGPANLIRSLIKTVSLAAVTTDVADQRIATAFPDNKERQRLPSNWKADYLIVTPGDNMNFIITELKKARRQHKQAKVVVLEDYPGAANRLIEELEKINLGDYLILTPTGSQAHEYRDRSDNEKKNRRLVFPVGQAAFDNLLVYRKMSSEDKEKSRQDIKQKLNIGPLDRVITYFGRPNTKGMEEYRGMNLATFWEVFFAAQQIALENPDEDIYILYKYHPKEPLEARVTVEQLNDSTNGALLDNCPPNLRWRMITEDDEKQLGVKNADLLLISDCPIVIDSTAGQEAALIDPGRVSPLHILLANWAGRDYGDPIDMTQRDKDLMTASGRVVLFSGASNFAMNHEQVAAALKKGLLGTDQDRLGMASAQLEFAKDWIFGQAESAKIVATVLELYQSFGVNMLELLKQIS